MITDEKKLIFPIANITFDLYESLKDTAYYIQKVDKLVTLNAPLDFQVCPIEAHTEIEKQISILIEKFNNRIDYINEYANCDCHASTSIEEYKKQINEQLENFVPKLLQLFYQSANAQIFLVPSYFYEEYSVHLIGIQNGKETIEKAEKSLQYWKDAVSEIVLQQSLLSLALEYAKCLYENKISIKI